MKKVISLKQKFQEVILIEEELDLFDSISPKIINDFKLIIKKLNNNKVYFNKKKLRFTNVNEENTISFLNNEFKNFYILDYLNPHSNFNFFRNFFQLTNQYEFQNIIFQKLHKNYVKIDKSSFLKKLLFFTPIYFDGREMLQSKNPLNIKFPSLLIKDNCFFEDKTFIDQYLKYFKKSKKIKNKISYVMNSLSDDKSRNSYEIYLFGDVQKNWNEYFRFAHDNVQYNDYIHLNSNSVIINAGVEYGSELNLFNNVDIIYNIDPGGNNYLDLSVKKIIENSKTKNIFIKSCLYSTEGVYTNDDSNLKLKTTSLLKIIDKYKIHRIDLIKSDIEGAERHMVDDLIKIAFKFRCQIAISIYHFNHDKSYEDLWSDAVDIPFKLISNLSDIYDFYFKKYSFSRYEAILYCIPKFKSIR